MRRVGARQYGLTERARRLLGREVWNIAVLDQPAADIVAHGITVPPRWLAPQPGGTWLADPACRLADGRVATLYAEALCGRSPRGRIWSASVSAGQDWTTARFAPLLDPGCHASYPFPFADEAGRKLLTAETWQAGCALLWEERDGPGPHPLGALLPGLPVVDPTPWRGEDGWWLFCTLRDAEPDGALHLYHAPTLAGPWSPHRANPVRTGRNGSRPAGPLFRAADGTLVRPGQDCSRTYGGAVVLHAVERLDRDAYRERVLRRLGPLPGPYPAGLHTICPAGEATLIDGKRWDSDLRSAAAKALRRARRSMGGGVA